jgi:hypothetical protein
MIRGKYSKGLKAQIALYAIKGQKTITELTSEYGLHANQIIIGEFLLTVFPAFSISGKDKDDKKKAVEQNHLTQNVDQTDGGLSTL